MLNYNFSFNKSTEKALLEAVTAVGVGILGIEINVDMVEADLETEVEIVAKEVVVDVLMVAIAEMTEEMIEDMEESVMNADQSVALDIHVERSDRTVTVDQEVDINSTKSLSCRSIWILIPYILLTIKILCQNLCITCFLV